MKIKNQVGFNLATLSAVLFTMVIGLYLRTPTLEILKISDSEEMAERAAYEGVRAQLASKINSTNPNLSEEARKKILDRAVGETIQNDHEQFNSVIKRFREEIESEIRTKRESSQYLLESDPYYYYSLVKRIDKEGKISDQFHDGKFFDPLRLAPTGSWDWMTFHPHVGYFFYRFVSYFTNMNLIQALSCVPLILASVSLILFFILCALLELTLFSTFCVSFIFFLAPMYVQRSAYGWFDTDVYNFIFPMSILILFFKGMKASEKQASLFVTLAGIVSAFYSFFWMGWPFIVVILAASLVFLEVVNYFLKLNQNKGIYLRLGIKYVLAAVISATLFMTPGGFIELVKNDLSGFSHFIRVESDIWPNLFALLGETKPATLPKIIFLTGSPLSFPLVLLGIILVINSLRKYKNHSAYSHHIPLLVFTAPLFVMALGAERFTLFLIFPFAIFAAYGIEAILKWSPKLMDRLKLPPSNFVQPLLGGFLLVVIAAFSGTLAYASMVNNRPIMNRTWHQALQEIDEKTPSNSIVNSWWDPGYFIIAIANRRSTVDGGSPHFHQTYWMARALAATDEREAAGILKMLNTSGNQALDFLEPEFGAEESIQLILKVISSSRNDARKILESRLSQADSKTLLDFILGKTIPPPSYVFLYDLIIEMNAGVMLVANWDFGRAKVMKQLEKSVKLGNYFQNMIAISGGLLKYTPESPLIKKEGNIAYFANDTSVDLNTFDVTLHLPEKKLSGQPISFFYVKNGEFIEKKYPNPAVDASCLLVQDGDRLSIVLADPRLIRSMLFRLYYLKGEGLKIFKVFSDHSDVNTKTTIRIFQVDWQELETEQSLPILPK